MFVQFGLVDQRCLLREEAVPVSCGLVVSLLIISQRKELVVSCVKRFICGFACVFPDPGDVQVLDSGQVMADCYLCLLDNQQWSGLVLCLLVKWVSDNYHFKVLGLFIIGWFPIRFHQWWLSTLISTVLWPLCCYCIRTPTGQSVSALGGLGPKVKGGQPWHEG